MSREPVILGGELAAARKAEADRIARGGNGQSPLRSVDRYNALNGDLELYDPVRLALDDRLSEICRAYEVNDGKGQAATRRSLSMEDLYTLMTFARRSAVFGWRNADTRLLADGLTAVAMIELARIDWRDAGGPPFVIFAIFHELGVDPTQAFANAASMAESGIAELLLSFRNRPASHKKLEAAGYAKMMSPHGPGLIERWGSSYSPTLPLDEVILQLAQLVREHQYSAHVKVAADLPDVWLAKVDDDALAEALSGIIAGASVDAQPLPALCSEYASQHFVVFLVETVNERVAQSLLRIARAKQSQQNNFALVAAQSGRLFCLCVARSYVVGKASFETSQSILRFLPGIETVLQTYAPS